MEELETSMNTSTTTRRNVLRFRSLFNEGRGYSFPCDSSGFVDVDAMSDRARCNYFFARTVIGREFAMPAVQPCELH